MFADDTSLSCAAYSPSELKSVINSELESLKTWLITSPLLDSLHLDNLSLRRRKNKVGMMFKVLKGDVPTYLQNLFTAQVSHGIVNL